MSNKQTKEKPKPKNTKSRTGCVTCKKRRLKCDESKPLCQNCIKKGIVCGGYVTNFKWRDFSETSSNQKFSSSITYNENNLNPLISSITTSNLSTSITNDHVKNLQNESSIPETTNKSLNLNLNSKLNSKSNSTSKPNSKLTSTSTSKLKSDPNSNKANFLQKALEEATLSVTGKSTQEIAIANVLIANGKNPELATAIASTLSGLADSENIQYLMKKKNSHDDTQKDISIKKEDDNDDIKLKEKSNNSNNSNNSKDKKLKNDSKNPENNENNEDVTIDTNKSSNNATINGNNNNNNNNLLHSLADIASKAPSFPSLPPSPSTEPFPTDAFIQQRKQKENAYSYSKIPNTLPPLNSDIISKNRKDSPLNLFKESPQVTAFSPPVFPKSPNISGFILSYQNGNYDNAISSINPNINSQTPKFEDLGSYSTFPQHYLNFSPMPTDSFNQNISNPNDISSVKLEAESPKNNRLLQNHPTPPFFNMTSIMNNESTSTMISTFTTTTGSSSNDDFQRLATPIFEIETPKLLNGGLSNPASPYASLLNYPSIAGQQVKLEFDHSKLEKNIDDENDDKSGKFNNALVPRNSVCSVTSLHSDMGSPKSISSEVSSSLDVIEHANRSPLIIRSNKPDLYSLHMSDEHLTTLMAFDQHTCGIMSIKNGPTENPWRTFLLPMSVDHSVVRSALLAMTCFHVARGDSTLRARGVRYMKDAIVSLVHGLSSDNKKMKKNQLKLNNSSSNENISKEIIKRTPPDVALATCIALAMGEAWDRHISTGIAHLKGAKSMIIRVLNKLEGKKKSKKRALSMNSSTSEYSSNEIDYNKLNSSFDVNENNDNSNKKIPKELQFLVNAWMYFDVLARMTSENENEEFDDYDDNQEDSYDSNENDSGDAENGSYEPINRSPDSESSISVDDSRYNQSKRTNNQSTGQSLNKKRDSSKRRKKSKRKETDSTAIINKFRSFNLEDGDLIDPLLGLAQTLFPLIGEVAFLIVQVRRARTKAIETKVSSYKTPLRLISRAVELKSAIEHWKIPPLPQVSRSSMKTEDPTFDLNAAVATAEAYRYSVLLYLHQAVPEVPSATSHNLAENVMMLLASVPSSSRTLVTHMFPLFVASCEARPGEEREWARERWTELIDKMWIGTIERAWEVVKEVWARKDALSGKKRDSIVLERESASSTDVILKDDKSSDLEYNKVKRRISVVIHGDDEDLIDDEDNTIGSWSHWTTIMKEWGWEVLLA